MIACLSDLWHVGGAVIGDIPVWKQIPDRKHRNKSYFELGEYAIGWENVCPLMGIRGDSRSFSVGIRGDSWGFAGIRAHPRA